MVSVRGPGRADASAAGCNGLAEGRVGRGRIWVVRESEGRLRVPARPAALETAARRRRTRGAIRGNVGACP